MEVYEAVSYTHLDVYKRQGQKVVTWSQMKMTNMDTWKQLRERWKKITNFQSFKIKKNENDEVK